MRDLWIFSHPSGLRGLIIQLIIHTYAFEYAKGGFGRVPEQTARHHLLMFEKTMPG